MAETLQADAHDHDFHHGEMPVAAQRSTFHSVMGLFKYGSLAIAVSLIFLVMWLCAHAGFFPSFVVAVIVAIAGAVFLGRKSEH